MTPERFLEVADLFADPALLLARDGTVIAANRAVSSVGWSPAELAGRRLTELVAGPPRQVEDYLRLSARSGDSVPGALALLGADGGATPCRCRAARAGGPDEEPRILLRCTPSAISPSHFAVLNQKIARLTDEIGRRQAVEARLHEQSEWLQVTLASIGDAILTTDDAGRVTFLNPVAERLTGWSFAEARGRRLDEVFPIFDERTRRPAENPVDRVLREGRVVGLANHTILIHRDGSETPIDDSAAPIRNDAGEVAGVVLVFRDVTERKEAERALTESQQKLRLLADTIPQLAWMARPDGDIFWFNRRWYEYTGTTEEEMAGWGWQRVHHPEVLPRVLEAWERSVATGERFEMTFPLRGADGHFRPFLTGVNPLRDDEGRIVYWFGTSTDVSEQERSGAAARFLAEASAALAGVGDPESTLQKVAWLAVPRFGDWCTILLGEPDGSLRRIATAHVDPRKLHRARRLQPRLPAHPEAPAGPLRVARTGEPELVEEVTEELLRAAVDNDAHAGALRELGASSYLCVPMRARGKVLGVIVFVAGESVRRYGEADLALAEGLADRAAVALENARLYAELLETDRRKDEFLATLAHELRNPLAPIRNALEILAATGADSAVAERTRAMMERQVQHLVRLVDDLLDVSRVMRGKIELQRQRTDLADVVAHAVDTVRPAIDAQRHDLELDLPDGPVEVDGDPVRLTQVIANLLANAAKYTPAGGSIRLTLTADGDAGAAEVRVRDNGIGIAPELLDKVFDLFVQVESSSVRAAGGLGIGLTLVRSLVALHGGTVEARSAGAGTGSELVVRLPLAGAASGPGEAEPGLEAFRQPPPRRRVLVVDDNIDAAESLATLLRLAGNDVAIAHDGPAALDLAGELDPEIVLLDLGMPLMDGFEVAQRLRRSAPDGLLLVALTGWGQEEDRRRTADAGFDLHLVKPVEPETLASVLSHPKLQRL